MEDWSVGTNVYMPAWFAPAAVIAGAIELLVLGWLLWRSTRS